MNTKKLIALLLCFVMVIGYVPMTVSAEDTVAASPTEKVYFDELIDFETGTVGEQVDVSKLQNALDHPALFTLGYSSAASANTEKHANRTFARPTESDSIALKSYGGRGIYIEDNQCTLVNNNFLNIFQWNSFF